MDWNPQDCRGIHRTQGESMGLKGTQEESTGLDRTQGESTELQETQGNPLDYLIIVKYIFISTCGDSNKVMYFVQLAGSVT